MSAPEAFAMFMSIAMLCLSGCNTGSDLVAEDPADGDPTDSLVEDSGTGDPDLVGNLEITKIALNQGVESVLFNGTGEAPTLQAPVVTNRDGLLRIHVKPVGDFESRSVKAFLTLTQAGEEDTVLTAKRTIDSKSQNDDLKSTINFSLTGDQIKMSTEFHIELREDDVDAPGGGDPEDVSWDSSEQMQGGLPTEQSDELTIVIIPVQYNADGSGRVPDTSDYAMGKIRDLAYAMYPATEVTIRVDPPLPWNTTIQSSGAQWTNLLDTISDMRDDANEEPNTYYYGLFNPASSVTSFCGSGSCILGLSNLGWSVQQEYLRASIGLGYTVADLHAETLVHEVGHAHGREHAPCGVSGDNNYPYNNAEIGTWGYDGIREKLFDPVATKDMMSYCSPIWVSDYTYYSLWERIVTLSSQSRAATTRVTRLRVDEQGVTTVRGSVKVSGFGGGLEVDVAVSDAEGEFRELVQGWMFPYSHIGGGVVTLDRQLPDGWTASVL